MSNRKSTEVDGLHMDESLVKTRVYCDKTTEARMTRLSLKSRPMPQVFFVESLTIKFEGDPFYQYRQTRIR